MPAGMTFSLRALGDLLNAPSVGEWIEDFLSRLVSEAGMLKEDLRKRPAPFAISSPMPVDEGRSAGVAHSDRRWQAFRVGEGGRFRLRLSWLADADLKDLLSWAEVLRVEPVRVETRGGPLLVEDALVSTMLTQRWNRWVPYGQLYDEASDSLRLVTLKFYSPTALKRSGRTYPLPDPCGVFLGYEEVWQAFSGIPLAPGLRKVIEEDLQLADFRLRRGLFAGAQGSVTGFVGSASYRLQGRHPESILKGLNVLADYAFFCGTGIGTERGMGLTRRIHDRPDRT
jgi:hypothetical protein